MDLQKKLSPLFLGILLPIFMLVAYSNHFHNSFHFDDFHTIAENGAIRSLKNIPDFFLDSSTSSSIPTHQGYRPLVTTLSAINYAQGELDPFWFHVSNFLIFVAIAILFYFVQINFYTEAFALLGSAWFGLLTIHAETVNYIISRSDLLSAFSIVASFALYLNFKGSRKYYFYLIPVLIGMFAKETSVMFAPMLMVYCFLFEKSELKPFQKLLSVFKKNFIPFTICVVFSLFTILMTHHHVTGGTSRFLYLLTEPYVLLHYVTQFFFPFGLSADTDMGMVSFPNDDRIYIGFTFLLGVLYLIYRFMKSDNKKVSAFGLSWFLIMLIPTSSVVPFAEVANDHRVLLPNLGLVMALMCGLESFHKTIFERTGRRVVFYCLLVIVLMAYAFGTFKRNEVWRSEQTLWADVVEKSPQNGRAWMNYGLTYLHQGNLPEANQLFERAKHLAPFYSPIYVNLGIVNGALGKNLEAEENFKKSIEYNQGELEPYFFYGRYNFEQKNYISAEENLLKALGLFKGHLPSLHLLMQVYFDSKSLTKLKNLIDHALQMYPNDAIAHEYLQKSGF